MNAQSPRTEECVAEIVKNFPVEDIWVLDAARAKECGLADILQLVVFVSDGCEAHKVEEEAYRTIRNQFGPVGLHVFSHTAMFQTPRPLLVKMAFSAGRQIYSR